MTEFLTYTIVGLSTAAIYAVAASGLVVTYTTSGIFNFAHGAMGMLSAFLYWQLTVGWGWPVWLALVVILLVIAPLFGGLVELVIMRGLQGTTEVTKLVVSVSLLLAMLGLANWVWDPNVARPLDVFFLGEKITIGEAVVTYHQLVTIGVAIAVAIGLRFFLYRTRTGIAMRASVDDRSLAMLNGGRPDLASMLAWGLGASLAAVSGILIAPALQLNAQTLTLLIVNAYAAAVIGRLRSIPLTFLGAVVLGLAESYAVGYAPTDVSWLGGIRPAVPVIILFAVLLILPQARLRGHSLVRSREFFPKPTLRGTLVFGIVLVALAAALSGMLSGTDLDRISRGIGLGIIALSLVPLVGYAGQISLCQLSFAGIGAVVMSQLGEGGSPVGLGAAFLVTAVVGALIALPALRLSGIYLALATAAFAFVLDRWIFTIPNVTILGIDINFFAGGSTTVERLELPAVSFTSARAQLVLLTAVFALFALFVVALRRSRFGYRLLAMKDSEAACATLGMNLTLTKLGIFALSAGMAGVGGALYAGLLVSVNPATFSPFESLTVLMMTVVGGIGAIGGALFAGLALASFGIIATALPALSNVVLVLPGTIGISLGRNPNGAVAEMRRSYAPVWASGPTVAVLGAVVVGAYAANRAGVLSNWGFAIAAVAALLLAPAIPMVLDRRTEERTDRERADDEPLEWVGIERPFRVDDVERLDRELGLHHDRSEMDLHGATRRS